MWLRRASAVSDVPAPRAIVVSESPAFTTYRRVRGPVRAAVLIVLTVVRDPRSAANVRGPPIPSADSRDARWKRRSPRSVGPSR